ncbi:MAG: isochorismatase family protein [Nitriliruptoraceae bacterium]|nr:isochorismatase family protein [Nitriliruptoraceae bacterium]
MTDPNRYWERSISADDLALFEKSGWGQPVGVGQRPAILVIDVNKNFCGDKREDIGTSVERWRASCGDVAWDAMPVIRTLIDTGRSRALPIVYTTGVTLPKAEGWRGGRWNDKNTRRTEELEDASLGQTIIEDIAPEEGEMVLAKEKPSAFFGTPLASHLIELGADSLIVCGTTTSGCVRSTVVDAFSYNFRVTVVADGTFDRSQTVHDVNLFDMDQKYADVRMLESILPDLPA